LTRALEADAVADRHGARRPRVFLEQRAAELRRPRLAADEDARGARVDAQDEGVGHREVRGRGAVMSDPHYDPSVSTLPHLTSRRNPIVAQFRRVRDGFDPELFVVEGVRFLEEAARCGAPLEVVLVTEELAADRRGGALVKSLQEREIDVRFATEEVLDAASSARTTQGIAAIARRRTAPLVKILTEAKAGLVVLAAGLADPGNLGTLLRAADAAGADGFLTTPETVSPWNDKAARASAGSIFRLPIAVQCTVEETARAARQAGFAVVAAAAKAGEPYVKADLSGKIVLILGSEGFGIAEETLRHSDRFVHIPLHHGVESLNVAVAGAILLFEAARRRAVL
jgi:TrmH family RNA methyltransferase